MRITKNFTKICGHYVANAFASFFLNLAISNSSLILRLPRKAAAPHLCCRPLFRPEPWHQQGVHRIVCASMIAYSLCLPTMGWPGWVEVDGWLHTEMVYPPEHGYPSHTNRTRRKATILWSRPSLRQLKVKEIVLIIVVTSASNVRMQSHKISLMFNVLLGTCEASRFDSNSKVTGWFEIFDRISRKCRCTTNHAHCSTKKTSTVAPL